MRKISIILLLTIIALETNAQKDIAFPLGEKITFKLHYGWFALGEATMSLDDSLIERGGKPYYHSKIEAGTVGVLSWMAGIQNEYEGFVSVGEYKTIESEKHLNEQEGKTDQWNVFDYDKMQTNVKEIKHFKEEGFKTFDVDLTENTYDLHGSYMYLRSQLGRKFRKGDSLMFKTYWHTKLYDFGMEYGGEQKIKYHGEKVRVKKFYALFPISKTFSEKKAVSLYILDKGDVGIPLLIEAKMRIGKVRFELDNYQVNGQTLNVLN